MTKKKAKKTFLRRIGKPAGVFLAAAAIIGLFVLLFAWAERRDRAEWLRQKGCWKKIYVVIEASPKEKAEWIKQTISNRAFLGGVDYCTALELIENGQDNKARHAQ